MEKKYFLLFIITFFSSICFAQTKPANLSQRDSKDSNAVTVAKSSNSVSETQDTFEKKPLPRDVKIAPDVFYIVNDKPVDYKTYMENMQKTKDKK